MYKGHDKGIHTFYLINYKIINDPYACLCKVNLSITLHNIISIVSVILIQ